MHILITYTDGTVEKVSVRIEGRVVAHGWDWIPGHLIDEPRHCHFQSDFFMAAIDEGGERSGEMYPAEVDISVETAEPVWRGFRWELIGSEAGACRAKLRKWIGCLVLRFDFAKFDTDYVHMDYGHWLTEDEAREYDDDMQCCLAYLDDVSCEILSLLREAGFPAAACRAS